MALTLVFAFHYAGFAAPLTKGSPVSDAIEWTAGQMGSLGTNLLLLLSGYFIARSTAKPKEVFGRFLAVRAVRIYGPYIFVLLAAAAFGALFPYYSRADVSEFSLGRFLEQLVLVPGLFPHRPVLTVTWTLSLIVPGYIILGAAGFWLPRREQTRVVFWLMLTLATVASSLYWDLPTVRFAYMPAGCMVHDARGMAEGSLRKRLWMAGAAVLAVLGVRIAVASTWTTSGWATVAHRALFTGSGIVAIAGLVAIFGVLNQSKETRWWRTPLSAFGKTGYSFYLAHGPVVKLFAMTVFPVVSAALYWWLMPVCMALSVAAAWGLYVCVERPCRELMKAQPPMRELQAAA